MPLRQELQELALANGMKYFGVASVDRFARMPEGHRPGDLLPGAKSVLVMGMVIPEGAIKANLRAYEGLRHAIFTYIVYGYNKINDQLDWAALQAIFHIEKLDFRGIEKPETPIDPERWKVYQPSREITPDHECQ